MASQMNTPAWAIVHLRWRFLSLLFLLSLLPSFPASSSSDTRYRAKDHPTRFSQPYPGPQGLVVQDGRATPRLPNPVALGGHQNLVSITLGVMSQCPDAQVCEDVIDKVLPSVADKVSVTISYIGTLDESSPSYGVQCRHGPPECRGNVQQLCYKKRFPELRDWWNFIQCQNYAGLRRIGDDDLARSCSKLNRHDWDRDVAKCVDSSEGEKLLQASVRNSIHLGIVKSCSILINNRLVCVHDGAWKGCPNGHQAMDFVKLINEEFDKIN